jgi:outer membrane protein TolC
MKGSIRYALVFLSMLSLFSFACAAVAPKFLHLQDAINLAIRQDPQAKSAKLQRTIDRFSLALAEHQFAIIPRLSSQISSSSGAHPTTTTTFGADWQMPLGPKLGVSVSKTDAEKPNYVATLSTPLLKGFGYQLTQIPLKNAHDQAKLQRLQFRDKLADTIISVMNAYWQVVQDEQTLQVQRIGLSQSKKLLRAYHIKLKSGAIAPRNYMQQKAEVLQRELDLEKGQLAIKTDRAKLIQALNLDVAKTARLKLDKQVNLSWVKPIQAKAMKRMAFRKNLEYQTALLGVVSARRSLKQASNEFWPNADLSASINNENHQQATLSVTIPLDRLTLKQQWVQAKISLAQAKQGLLAQRLALNTALEQDLFQLRSQLKQLKLAEDNLYFQRKNVNALLQGQKFGKVSSFELITEQKNLMNSEINLISQKVGYLKAYAAHMKRMGSLLQAWGISLASEDKSAYSMSIDE